MADMDLFKKYGMIFILVIVGFSLVAALYPEATAATDSVNASNMCASASCFYNASRTTDACTTTNTTPDDTTLCASAGQGAAFPLSGLVAGGGVLFIVIAAGLLMMYLRKSR